MGMKFREAEQNDSINIHGQKASADVIGTAQDIFKLRLKLPELSANNIYKVDYTSSFYIFQPKRSYVLKENKKTLPCVKSIK